MAVNVYYGSCVTPAATPIKVVNISSSEVTTNDFSFEIGDLLVVYFTDTNEADSPSIVINNEDTEQEVSTSDDSGKFIKINSVKEIEDPIGIWDAGETVIFAYTSNITQNDNTYYWELIDAARATEEVSGVTKLYGTANTDVSEWIADDLEPADFDKALTPGILKKFYGLLIGKHEDPEPEPGPGPGPEPSFPTLHLTWFPEDDQQELIKLGTLSLNSDKEQGITINYPLDQRIEDKIHNKISKTSDLFNDGHADDDTDSEKEDGGFYITNIIPSDRSLYYSSSPTPYAFLIPNSNESLVLNSKDKIQLNGATGTIVANGLTVNGGITSTGAVNSGGINSTGIINANGNKIVTTGELRGGTIYENNFSLREKYSGSLWRRIIEVKKISINANESSGHKYINLGYSGWTPIAVAGFNLNYNQDRDTGAATWCHLWECSITGNNQLEYAIRNHKNKKVVINAVFHILYVRNI